jgi:hypothetical protein
MPTQDLNTIANVVVEISPMAAPRSNFNTLLIIGDTGVFEAAERLRLYTSLAQMLADGFLADSPEYLAASKYVQNFFNSFGAGAAFRIYIGLKDEGETALQAIQACRAKDSEWYIAIVTDAVKADHLAIAAWIQTAVPASAYAFTTSDADALAGTAGNVFETLKGLEYNRCIGQYSSDPYAIASIMGYAMGQNTLVGNIIANSSYTLKFKKEVGVAVENLTPAQIAAIEADNGNVYLNYANFYNIFEQGVMANGQFFDEVCQLDMLSNRIQLAVMDLLYQNDKIPQTDGGVTQIMQAINSVCDDFVTVGFIAPGVWRGLPVLNLATGDTLTKGYMVQAPPVSSQSQADREARKCVPIYVAIKLAGAVHSSLIQVNVNR